MVLSWFKTYKEHIIRHIKKFGRKLIYIYISSTKNIIYFHVKKRTYLTFILFLFINLLFTQKNLFACTCHLLMSWPSLPSVPARHPRLFAFWTSCSRKQYLQIQSRVFKMNYFIFIYKDKSCKWTNLCLTFVASWWMARWEYSAVRSQDPRPGALQAL